MKIVKSIRLSEDNIQEIMDCPVVYKITKKNFDPAINDEPSCNLNLYRKPSIIIYLVGCKETYKIDGKSCLYLTEDGYWRCLPVEVMESYLNKTNG